MAQRNTRAVRQELIVSRAGTQQRAARPEYIHMEHAIMKGKLQVARIDPVVAESCSGVAANNAGARARDYKLFASVSEKRS